MANPLDDVTQDRSRDDSGNPLRRVYIDTSDAPVPQGTGAGNALVQATQAAQPTPEAVPWTIEDLQRGVEAIKQYVAGNVAPVNDMAKRFTNYDRQFTQDVLNLPRNVWNNPQLANKVGQEVMYDNWLTKMVKSGATLPGQVSQGIVPVTDPETGHTAVPVIERAQDIAGMATGSMLFGRPGAGTLGSGPVRPAMKLSENVIRHTDAEGYTSFIVPKKPGEKLTHAGDDPRFADKDGIARQGEIFIQSPTGEVRKAGYWMDKPEREWGISKKQWDKMPVEEKLALETKQQATAYEPLKEQFLSSDSQQISGAATLGAGPVRPVMTADRGSLIPAIKVSGKLYKGKVGQEHSDLVPPELMDTLRDRADRLGLPVEAIRDELPGFRQGFINHKGHFLSQESAGKYVKSHPDLVSPENYKALDDFGFRFLTSDLLHADSQPGTAISALAQSAKGPAPVFYSALEHAATNAVQETMSPQQWLGFLKNTPGVKAEELAWTGLPDWLGAQKGKVKKEDVRAYLDEHKVEIKDVTKQHTSDDPFEVEAHRLTREEYPDLREGTPEFREQQSSYVDHLMENDWQPNDFGEAAGASTRHSDYQLPGGENYREHLLTMPAKNKSADARAKQIVARMDEISNEYPKAKNSEDIKRLSKEYDDLTKEKAELRSGPAQQYNSSHWDEPNVLAHVRTNDRSMERPLTPEQTVVNETRTKIQSQLDDLQREQAAAANEISAVVRPLEKARQDQIRADIKAKRVSGAEGLKKLGEYYEHPEIKPLQDKLGQLRAKENELRRNMPDDPRPDPIKSLHIEEIQSDWHQQGRKQGYRPEQEKKMAELKKQRDDLLAEANKLETSDPRYKEIYKDLPRIQREINDIGSGDVGVPDAPFKTSWPELALKRMIRKAAEEGYDRISWTPGEAQAARYDLSKHIDAVRYIQHGNDKFSAMANKDGRTVAAVDRQPLSEIEKTFGKEVAEKIAAKKEPEGYLRGLDLKVGGEGMREFYDKMLPRMAEKIGKSYGVKVKTTKLPGEDVKVVKGDDGHFYLEQNGKRTDRGAYMTKAGAEKDAAELSGGHPVHYFDLPQPLKEHAIGRGFPLYMSGVPFPLTPVDYNPFEKKK